MNPKGHNFQEYLETFIETATRIADAIDLNMFVDLASLANSPEAEAAGGGQE